MTRDDINQMIREMISMDMDSDEIAPFVRAALAESRENTKGNRQ